ncbi:MAG: hypothetical protein HKO59_07370 [Phycisphaerales bacterium]|nr:hypothetical protein [Phycisphaerae bacterium]NNF42725.1 hypothetical protein [Phycisphaerales bacterium]NNM25795.1 hypothetical protein [Phycisphaerales bacterium]
MSRQAVVDRYFMEHRAKLLDVAAFLDRVERGGAEGDDFRMAAFRRAVAVLAEPGASRARRILELLSDPTDTPIDSAAGLKGAFGAYPGGETPA